MPRDYKKAFQRDSRNGIPDELLTDVSVAQFQDSNEFVSGRVFPVIAIAEVKSVIKTAGENPPNKD